MILADTFSKHEKMGSTLDIGYLLRTSLISSQRREERKDSRKKSFLRAFAVNNTVSEKMELPILLEYFTML